MKVLVAEDNEVSRKILDLNLRKWGCLVFLAGNGKEALAHLESNADIQMVITDIRMPEMDGFTLLKTIKADSRWRHIPVVMCTELNDLEAVKAAISMDCAGYMVKPIIPALFFSKIFDILKNEPPIQAEIGNALSGESNKSSPQHQEGNGIYKP